MSAVDPLFIKVVNLMRSTQHEGERASAQARAETIAANCGMTFEQAIAIMDRPPVAAPKRPASIFEGFDDWVEAREPGWKAARSAEKDARRRAQFARKVALIERYGTKEAAIAPCWREERLLKALKPWRKACKRPHQRWTYSVEGCDDGSFRPMMSDQVRSAVVCAYPWPTTFVAAKAEHDYWDARRRELEDLLDDDLGDDRLDRVCQLRAEMIRDLVFHELPTTTLVDLHARMALLVESNPSDEMTEKAIFRDLTVMVEREKAEQDGAAPRRAGVDMRLQRSGQIEAELRRNPASSDRRIARALGCSPTTVGNVRRSLGLGDQRRSVQRGGQTYQMKASGGGRA